MMSAIPATRTRTSWTTGRWLTATLLMGIGCYFGRVFSYEVHRRQLIAEVIAADGAFGDDNRILWRLVYWYRDGKFPEDRSLLNICCRSGITNDWLRRHDWLRGLDAECLLLHSDQVTGSDLARLIEVQPFESLSLDGVVMTEEILSAVRSKPRLTRLSLANSDLTDAQLARLDLRFVKGLELSGSRVTSNGISLLRHCTKLTTVTLDAEQIAPGSIATLASVQTLESLILRDQVVTDDELIRLAALRGLRYISLHGTSTTPEGRAELRAAMPGCAVVP
jgi:hypothetical protein